MSALGLGCVETAGDRRRDLSGDDVLGKRAAAPGFGFDRRRVGGYCDLKCAGEVKLAL
jgi:hypothetical protein